ncbi:hypothetical protein GGR58DRAFT_505568 [Xylaria digitata]|nr:hypothetical protein GGR58DRAFT_505568 [Xylaria digitata]
MASPECKPRKPFSHELVSLGDAELDQYLEEHRLEGGAVTVDVEDPGNLPESFIQRLRDRAQNTSNMAQSRAVDLDRVTARLLEVPTDNDALPRPLYSGGTVADSYPIELLDDVVKDPRAHREMLRPWLKYPDADRPKWEVFREQWNHWQNFLYWQAQSRGLGLPPFANLAYKVFDRDFRRKSPTYTEAAKDLLARYGFTRPFQFHDDPKRQDKLTTWMNILAILDAKVLRPFETEEYILTIECAIRQQHEEDRAFRAVKSAEAILMSEQMAEDNLRVTYRGESAAGVQSHAAQSRLDAAKESLAVIERRNNLVTKFHVLVGNYLIAKGDEKYHRARLQWVLEQVPLVEAEMNECGVTETNPTGTRNTKRRRDQDNIETQNQINQKRRRNTREPNSLPGRNTKPRSQGRIRKSSYDDTADDKPPSKRLINSYQDPASHSYTPSGAQTEPAREPQESRTSRIRRPDGDKQVLTKIKEYPSPKVIKPTDDSLLQRKNIQDAPHALEASLPLRRSARIAARQQILKTMNSSSVAQVPPRITKKQVPSSSTELQSQLSKF